MTKLRIVQLTLSLARGLTRELTIVLALGSVCFVSAQAPPAPPPQTTAPQTTAPQVSAADLALQNAALGEVVDRLARQLHFVLVPPPGGLVGTGTNNSD